MDVKGKIEIIIKEKEDEVKVERVTADWDEVIEFMAYTRKVLTCLAEGKQEV